jgi:hypothetical protein
VTCNGIPTTAGAFACSVPLAPGLNEVVVRAVDAAGNHGAARIAVTHVPGGISGAPDAPAADAIATFNDTTTVADSDVGVDEAGDGVVLTQIEIGLVADTTVAQVNDLLGAIDGRIISMLRGVGIVLVRIPHPGDVAGLQEVIAQADAHPAVRFTNRAYLPHPDALPESYAADLANGDRIGHHLAVGGHAAWNAKAGITRLLDVPVLFVIDYFGDGKPDDVVGGVLFADQFRTGAPDAHGYHILGIARGVLGGDGSDRGLVTGLFPRLAGAVNVIDLTFGLSEPQWQNALIASLQELAVVHEFNVVVNTSLGFGCSTPEIVAARCNEAYATQQAVIWIEKVRAAGIEDKVVHVDSAGNVDVPGDVASPVNDWFAAAALLPSLETLDPVDPQPVPNLTNTLVVENLDWWFVGARPTATCLRSSSKVGGNIAAVGTEVWSITDADSSAGYLTGTSMAAPQVAAAAQYVWALNPTLTAQQVVGTLTATARPGVGPIPGNPSCSASASAPVLDVYAAVLDADLPSALDGSGPAGHAPARLALLDVAGDGVGGATNGRFDESDVDLFLSQLDVAGVFTPDYSRFDLNGDAYTGGGRVAGFDLDISGPPATDTVTQQVDGSTVSFDEAAVTDVQVLCYYAYSRLYTGDEATRDALLVPHCSGVELAIDFPDVLEPGVDTNLVVRAVRTRDDGSTTGVDGLHVTLNVIEGGVVAVPSGTTHSGGYVETQARLSEGSDSVEILVALFSSPTGSLLDEARVTADAAAAGGPSGLYAGTYHSVEDGSCYAEHYEGASQPGWIELEHDGGMLRARLGRFYSYDSGRRRGFWDYLMFEGVVNGAAFEAVGAGSGRIYDDGSILEFPSENDGNMLSGLFGPDGLSISGRAGSACEYAVFTLTNEGAGPPVDLTGTWSGTNRFGETFTYDFTQSGDRLTGTSSGGSWGLDTVSGRVIGNDVVGFILVRTGFFGPLPRANAGYLSEDGNTIVLSPSYSIHPE